VDKKHFVILGAGPAGLGAAYKLAREKDVEVTVLELQNRVGGNAGSFELDGVYVDYGSHRLHPACDPEVLTDIHKLLGDDLIDRPRYGRIRLRGRWIHFPLKPVDLALKLPPDFVMGVAGDMFGRVLGYGSENTINQSESFGSVLEVGLGRTICRDFYFPYARKIWGVEPEQLSAIQAHRRVSAGSIKKMVGKALSSVPGLKSSSSGRFYYPRRGYGQISEAYCRAAQEAGAQILLNSAVQEVEISTKGKHVVRYKTSGNVRSIRADYIWSTIPITILTKCIRPSASEEIVQAAANITFRQMILIYLVLGQDRFSEYDAHYFPGSDIPITRLSEPKNYSDTQLPYGRTVLCAELPCRLDDDVWSATDEQLGQVVSNALENSEIPLQAPILKIVTRRLKQAYPIYYQGYARYFDQLDTWISQFDGLLSFGRQGLFAHDNTHHALFMAYSAVDCVDGDGVFDRGRWRGYRQVFETHVVED
jgi:protoporphyrinogen oxidase